MHFFEEKLYLRLGQFFGVCVGCLSVAFYVIKIEKRAVFELALKGAWQAYGAGFTVGGLMMSERSGPDWLTGGAFGIEGSAIALVVVVLASGVMLALAQRQGRMVLPLWKR